MKKGLIKTVIIIAIGVVILSYLGFDLKRIIESPQNRENFSYITVKLYDIWINYLREPAHYLWYDVFLDLIWEPAIENLENIKDGKPMTTEADSPKIPDPPQNI